MTKKQPFESRSVQRRKTLMKPKQNHPLVLTDKAADAVVAAGPDAHLRVMVDDEWKALQERVDDIALTLAVVKVAVEKLAERDEGLADQHEIEQMKQIARLEHRVDVLEGLA